MTTAAATVKARSGPSRRRSITYRLITDGIPVALLFVWYFASFTQPEYILPNPLKVAYRSLELLGLDPDLAQNTLISLFRVLLSVVAALTLGSILVFTARYIEITRGLVVQRIMPFFNAAPTLGWAIVGIYWFGISDYGVVFVETAILLPFSMINMWSGLQNLDEETLEMATSFSRNRPKVLSKVVVPLLLPYIFAAVRLSYGAAWKVSLIAELFGAQGGLGYILNLARESFDSVTVFSSVIVLIILVYVVQRFIFDPIEMWLSPQRRSEQIARAAEGAS